MGNCCSDANNKSQPNITQISYQEFRTSYRSFKFPRNVAFTGDLNTFRIRHKFTKKPYILKRMAFSTENDLLAFSKNLDALSYLEHDNILKIHHYCIEKIQLNNLTLSYTLNIILENFEHTLQDELAVRSKSNRSFTETEVQYVLNNLVDALQFLQLKELSLGDIRPSNIYLTQNKKPKVMFLGTLPTGTIAHPQDLSSVDYISPQIRTQTAEFLLSEKISSIAGSPPQTFTPLVCNNFKSDVFSLGLITLDMMAKNSVKELSGNNRDSIRKKCRVIESDKAFGPFLCGVVEAMLRESEKARPDFIELKKMMVMEEYLESSSTLQVKRNLKLQEMADKKYTSSGSKALVGKSTEDLESPDLSFLVELNEDNRTNQNIKESPKDLFGKTAEFGSEMVSKKQSIEIRNDNNFLSEEKGFTARKRHTFFEHSEEHSHYDDEAAIHEYEHHGEDTGARSGSLDYEEVIIENELDLYDIHQKHITTLSKLVLNLEDNEFAYETRIMLKEIISRQTHLTELVLSMPKANLGDDGLEAICEGVDELQEVAMCYFDFRKCEISDYGLMKFGECLLRKSKLVQLALNFSDNSITEEGCREIAGWFKSFKNIQSLALNIGGNGFGNEGVIAVGKELGKMEGLEGLTVFLYSNGIQGKEGIQVLLNGIKELEHLEKITLNLVGNQLKDEEMDILLEFVDESEVEEIIVDLKDNLVSEEGRKKAKLECVKKENVIIRF